MKPLKDIYAHEGIFRQLAEDMKAVYPPLKQEAFYKALTESLDQLELKARIVRAAEVCYRFFPKNYEEALGVLYRFVEGKRNHLFYLFLPTFVARYGQRDYNRSLKALRDFTQYSSSEEGIRTFLEQDCEKTLRQMLTWAQSENTHIRRLASEGCRPRLPWAKRVPALIKNPRLTWPILDALKEDPQKYVQKSVANHINDISKDHPDWIVAQVKRWDRTRPSTAWIVKHGMRGLIKSGHKGALELFGYHETPKVRLENVKWIKKVQYGNPWEFSLELVAENARKQKYLVDYQIHFHKKNGRQAAKTFKLKTFLLSKGERATLAARYRFKDLTTRKHTPGPHAWQLLINGVAGERFGFEVVGK